LPVVLKAYGKAIFKELAELADLVAITGKSDEEKANKFIDAIVTMNIKMDIPNKLGVIQEKDIPEIIKRALKEANPAYPVPVIWDYNKLEAVLEKL
jgi:alcohol dehydrogenase class IV